VGASQIPVRRARAVASLLAGGASAVEAVPRALVGVQAQDMAAAELAIRARTQRCSAHQVRAAVAAGDLVVTWTLRGTRHLHAAEDVRWLLALFGPVAGRPRAREHQLGIAGAAGEAGVAALRRALSTGPLTREGVREVLAPLGIDVTGQAPIHVVQRAASEGVLCILPAPGRGGPRAPRTAEDRYVLLDDWVPRERVPQPGEAAARLAARYRAAFWPAGAPDFRAWSGLPARLAGEGWAAAGGDAGPPVTDPAEPVPLRLAGAFDPLLLGYADRSAQLPPAHAVRVNAGGGMVRPVVYDDGEVVGTWGWGRSRLVEVAAFGAAPPEAALGDEIADIERFLGAPRPGSGRG